MNGGMNGPNGTVPAAPAPTGDGNEEKEGSKSDKEEKKKKRKPTLLYDNEMVSMEEQRFMNPKYRWTPSNEDIDLAQPKMVTNTVHAAPVHAVGGVHAAAVST